MRILVVFTGGTIGSIVKNGVADTDSSACEPLIQICSGYSDIEFEYCTPFQLLSENITCSTLSDICSFMLSIDFEKYTGIILTHGSDTLAYTSAMLGMALSFVKIPIIITAANYVLDSPKSNGLYNFRASVEFIREFHKKNHSNTGVFTIWKNNGEDTKVYISTRLNEADGFLDSFSSWGGTEFGIVKDNCFIRSDNPINPIVTAACEKTSFLMKRKIIFPNNIILIQSYPGLDYNSVKLTGKSAAVVRLYHSATACTQGDNTSILKFAERCHTLGVELYLYSAKNNDYIYKSAENITGIHFNHLFNINTFSAYCKVLLAFSVDKKDKYDIINTNLFYETIESQTDK